jgi:hypothetical protein
VAIDGDTCPQVAESATLTEEVGTIPLLKTVRLTAELVAEAILEGVAEKLKLGIVITGEATARLA